MSNLGASLFMLALWGPVLAYVPLQIAALFYARGVSRWVILAPVPIALIVTSVTVIALLQNSNLWPCWLFVIAPVMDVYLIVLMIVSHQTLGRRRQRLGQCPACGYTIAPGTCGDGVCSECGARLPTELLG